MEAAFQPGAPVGYVPDQAYKGLEEGQSMMMRASQLRQQQQMEQLRQQQMAEQKMLMPVKVAAAQADLASAVSSVATNTRIQGFRQQAAEAAPMANNEFLDALQLSDWDAQANELSRIQAKYSFMGQLPEYKDFLKAVDEARGNAIIRQKTDQTLEAEQTRAETMAAARPVVAQIGADARVEAAAITAGSRESVADKGIASREKIAGGAHESSEARAEYRGNMQSALEADKEAIKFAEGGNDDAADQARKRADSFRRMAKKSLDAPAAANPFSVPNVTDKAATPAAPKKLYQVGREGEPITFTGAVKNPEDVGNAIQQAVNDGVITAEEGKQTLIKLGWKPKG